MVSYTYLGYGVTDENGIAKLEYNSEGQKRDHSYTGVGAGEVDVLASLDNPIVDGSIVSETLTITDYWRYIASESHELTGTGLAWYKLADLNGIDGDWKITCTISSNHTNGLGLAIKQADSNANTYLMRVGYGSENGESITSKTDNIVESWYGSNTYVADTDSTIEMTYINGVYTFKINNFQKTFTNPPSNLRYVGLESWNNTKTLTITDFKVEKL